LKKASLCLLLLFFILYSNAFSAGLMPTPTFTPTPGWCSVLNFPVVLGWVNAITATSDSVYAGGYFSLVGPRTGSGAAINPATGAIIPGFPELAGGIVYTAISDGSGGWYAGGSFSYAAGLAKGRLVHIYANGSLDPVFNPNTAGTVTALLLYNGSLYESGGAGAINAMAKLDPATGTADPGFNAQIQLGGSVNVIISEGANLVIGGDFSTIAGQARGCAARVNAATGALDASFDPEVQGSVFTAASDGSSYYFGGYIYSSGSPAQTRNNIVKVGAATGALDASFAPAVNSYVCALYYDGTSLYIGGEFTIINAAIRSYLAKLDPSTGVVDTSFAAVPDAYVYGISAAGAGLFVGGTFLNVNTTGCQCSAKVDKLTGEVDPSFTPGANNAVMCIAYDGANAYICGNFSSLGSIPRPHLVKINVSTGVVDTAFNANLSGVVYSLCLGNNSIYAGGMFSMAGGVPRSNIAKLDLNTGAVDPSFVPGAFTEASGNPKVNAIAFDGTDVYVGGVFNSIGGISKDYIAKLNGTTAGLDPSFNASAVYGVYYLLYDGANVFEATWGSTPSVQKLDPSTGAADLSFNPGVTADVECLADDGVNLFIGGGFNIEGGQPRDDVAKISKSTGQVDNSFALQGITNAVSSLALDGTGSGLFVAGIWNLGALNQSYALRADPVYGYFDNSFRPVIDGSCNSDALSPSNDILYLGGQFSMVSRFSTTGFVALCLKNPPTQTMTPVYSHTFTPSMTRTITLTGTITATITQSGTVTETLTITETPTITETGTITETHTVSPTITDTMTRTETCTLTQTNTIIPTSTASPYIQTEQVIVYPDPVKDKLVISFKDGKGADKAEVWVYTVSLRRIRDWAFDANPSNIYTLDFSGLANGTYILAIKLIKNTKQVYKKILPIIVLK
jgi:hypothetical protein